MSTAIAGLGMTELGKVYGRSPRRLAADAVRLAAADAGLPLADLDGLLVSHGLGGSPGIELADALGLRNLRLLSTVNSFGATAGAMIAHAAMSIMSGAATTVACVFADAPLKPKQSSGAAYHRDAPEWYGFSGMTAALGLRSVNAHYALAAQRHMARYGTTSEQLGAIAVSTREWATRNPLAQMREPITLDDHQASRWVAEPLHLLDCCLVSNGAIAVIVTGSDRARSLAKPPVHLWGWGQGHPGHRKERDSEFGLTTGALTSGPTAMKMAGITPDDVTVAELYDCYTYTVLVSLEDYGFCEKGEGGAFAASGALGPGGSLPTNTGGGQLSSYYMWGMTPLSEAIIQARGEGGDRQVDANDVILVSGNGGILDHHSTLILSPHEKSAPVAPAGRPALRASGAREAAPAPASVPSGPVEIGRLKRDGRTDPFFDGTADDRLVIKRCESCETWFAPDATGCTHCGAATLAWADASGEGTLVTWTVTHGRPSADGTAPPPAYLALVELAEGPWLHGRLSGVSVLREGLPLRATYVHPEDGEAYVLWTE
ncbi:thiolase C-terminal domain-containing protein [Spirillospora albida]|uniref:thiolase C-terminal domain-containing protein n=1 Tax=Spirillospora albida TaxID=58123 RepID=UPI000A6FEDFD|nr:OB-fold domain-containing protein [Spirillospora albida]